MSDETEQMIGVAEELLEKVEAQRGAHYMASDHLRIWHYALGLLLIAASAVVSGSVLQASETNPSHDLTLTAGALSVFVVVLTAVQTTFKLGERGEQHRSAAAGFGKVARELTFFIKEPHPDLTQAWAELRALDEEIDGVEAGAPGFLSRTYDKAKKKAAKERSA